MNVVLQANNLVKTYGEDNTKVEAIKAVNLEVLNGEFIVITGASGSGKSTLLHLLGGLDTPSEGTVLLNNRDIYKLNDNELTLLRRHQYGFVFQSYNLVQELTAYENIVLPLILDEYEIDNDYIDPIIECLGLQNRLSHLPSALSGGQQQKVAIARALANKPSVILADELTGNLDSKATLEVLNLLNELQQKYQQTVIIVTHDNKIAESATRILKLSDGQIVYDSRVTNE